MKRGTSVARAGYHTIGELMILKPRDNHTVKLWSECTLQKFYDALVRIGSLPIPLVRKVPLGAAGSPL
jgi:uncharacterized protein (DUF885 family)